MVTIFSCAKVTVWELEGKGQEKLGSIDTAFWGT